ncbi:unnamed protein product [Didymodactylos carnosus]|uniref:Uncharacterized protein n=1 Tax=Didymodactylos carnosus TaxID=1234261 RepID=A0A814DHP1_9BILA|nr:unnamed protein product [Didymodactylos carnosus]CAF3729859.1 unnamed protein product [Didymodactylos carnosus]
MPKVNKRKAQAQSASSVIRKEEEEKDVESFEEKLKEHEVEETSVEEEDDDEDEEEYIPEKDDTLLMERYSWSKSEWIVISQKFSAVQLTSKIFKGINYEQITHSCFNLSKFTFMTSGSCQSVSNKNNCSSYRYTAELIPLIHSFTNLKELRLNISGNNNNDIDLLNGHYLKQRILINDFKFHICLTNNDLDRCTNSILSTWDSFSVGLHKIKVLNSVRYYLFSLPYQFERLSLSSNFLQYKTNSDNKNLIETWKNVKHIVFDPDLSSYSSDIFSYIKNFFINVNEITIHRVFLLDNFNLNNNRYKEQICERIEILNIHYIKNNLLCKYVILLMPNIKELKLPNYKNLLEITNGFHDMDLFQIFKKIKILEFLFDNNEIVVKPKEFYDYLLEIKHL